MARLYSNENFPLRVVQVLRQLGHDVVTVQESGLAGRGVPDKDVLEFAIKHDRAVLTLNRRHFIQLHNSTPNHAGIIVCTVDADFARHAALIHEALEKVENLHGTLIRVNRPG